MISNDYKLTIVRDDGFFRHLQLRQPDTLAGWFEIVTWPGSIAINGDMGSYVFSKGQDMFEFFSWDDGDIKPEYWASKCVAADVPSNIKEYSADKARKVTREWIEEAEEAYPGLRNDVEDLLMPWADDGEIRFRDAVDGFQHEDYEFEDFWEADLQIFSPHYLWCCHAIVFAIDAYRTQTANQNEAA